MNFLKKIFSPSCLIISLFLLIYTFYKSEIHFDGKKSDIGKIVHVRIHKSNRSTLFGEIVDNSNQKVA